MRRKDRNITSAEAIESILSECTVCRLGLCDDGKPYVVPLNYHHEGTTVYLHCAKQGRKLDILSRNSAVCFEVDVEGKFIPSEERGVCDSDYEYRSLIAEGSVRIVTDVHEKERALQGLAKKYFGREAEMSPTSIKRTIVMSIELENIAVKQSTEF